MNLQTKLILIVVPLVMTSLVTFGIIAFIQMNGAAKQNTTQNMISTLDHVTRNIENEVNTATANVELFSDSPMIVKYLLQEDENTRIQLFQRSLLKLFASYQLAYPQYYEIRILTLDGYEDTRVTSRYIKNLTDDEGDSTYFKLLKNSNKKILTTISINPDTKKHALYIAKRIDLNEPNVDPTLANPIPRGYLIITMGLELLDEITQKTTIRESGEVFFIDNNAAIIFDKDNKKTGLRLNKEILDKLNSNKDINALVGYQYDSKDYLYQKRSPHPDIHLIGMLPESELYADSLELGKTMSIALVFFIATTIISLLIALKRIIVNPILNLERASQKIGAGDLHSPIKAESADAIGKLSTTLDQMRINLNNYQEQADESREEAIAANQAKSQFLANMSHEIRTPLTAIIGFSESLLDKSRTDEQNNESINTIINSGKHLMQIINNILDLSKIEAGEMQIEKLVVSPFQLIDEMKAFISTFSQEKCLEFTVEYQFPIPEKITTDPVRFKQILLNLCTNAIKFTQQGSINLFISFSEKTSQLQVDVIDTGIGLTDEQIANLFEPFHQADASTTRKYGGTGLGLYLSRQLAEKLGGDISVTSEIGNGCCFTVSFDCGDLNQVALLSATPESDNTNNINNVQNVSDTTLSGRVLLAEDNMNNQQLISMYINACGANVDIANNGEIAVEKARNNNYDLILMDMQMPVMGGIEATETLRAENYSGLIVALTANAMLEDKMRCMKAGCNDVLTKPIDRNKFTAVLKQHLSGNKSKAIE